MLNIIESGPRAWALATTNGDLRIYSRDADHEWSEMFLSDDSEQLDESGSLILEALYEQQTAHEPDEADEAPELEDQEPEAEGDEEPQAEEDEDEVPEQDEGEDKPRRSRTKTRARKR